MEESRHILVADDSIFFRTKLSDILMVAGHKVRFAANGNEVVADIAAGKRPIDLLILDLQMPELDGFGVLEWIKKSGHGKRFPILAVTDAYGASDVLKRLKDLGASGFMSKEMTPEQIIMRVNQFLFPRAAPPSR